MYLAWAISSSASALLGVNANFKTCKTADADVLAGAGDNLDYKSLMVFDGLFNERLVQQTDDLALWNLVPGGTCSASTKLGFIAATCMAISCASRLNSSVRATKSVSQLSSTIGGHAASGVNVGL